MISILIASWIDVDRNSILSILSGQKDFLIAGVEKDEVAAIMKSEKLKPDILILDIPQSSISCTELAPIIHRRSPSTGIIMLSDRDEENYACLAIKAGIQGFLVKKTDMNKLASAVRIVNNGEVYVNDSILHRVFDTFNLMSRIHAKEQHLYKQETPSGSSANYQRIINSFYTPTERGIITLLAQGNSDDQIADLLHLCAGTIRNCMTTIRKKTRMKSRSQIVVFSIYYGLINFDKLEIPLFNETGNIFMR